MSHHILHNKWTQLILWIYYKQTATLECHLADRRLNVFRYRFNTYLSFAAESLELFHLRLFVTTWSGCQKLLRVLCALWCWRAVSINSTLRNHENTAGWKPNSASRPRGSESDRYKKVSRDSVKLVPRDSLDGSTSLCRSCWDYKDSDRVKPHKTPLCHKLNLRVVMADVPTSKWLRQSLSVRLGL